MYPKFCCYLQMPLNQKTQIFKRLGGSVKRMACISGSISMGWVANA